MLLYAIYRVSDLYSKNRIKEYAMAFCRCSAHYLLGVLNAMIVFMHVLFAFAATVDGKKLIL